MKNYIFYVFFNLDAKIPQSLKMNERFGATLESSGAALRRCGGTLKGFGAALEE